MRERGIIFSAPMVRALLEGRKTQTRRITSSIKVELPSAVRGDGPSRSTVAPAGRYVADLNPHGAVSVKASDGSMLGIKPDEFRWVSPYGQPGDRLYVKESFLLDPDADDPAWATSELDYACWADQRSASRLPESLRRRESVLYAATWEGTAFRWRSPIFMPRWASRITLELTGVDLQRLQSITDVDAWAEGVQPSGQSVTRYEGEGRNLFAQAWKQLHGEDSWWDNPWVWKISFSVIDLETTDA